MAFFVGVQGLGFRMEAFHISRGGSLVFDRGSL